jgi:uncharacterized membrane protein
MELEKLKQQKDQYITKIFYLGLKIALIFAIPAVGGVLLGKRLDVIYGTGKTITYSMLAFAFILSWTITLVMYNNLAKKIKKVEHEIKIEKDKITEADKQIN